MHDHMSKDRLKKKIRFYAILAGICLMLAAGINTLMEPGRQDPGESELIKSLKSELEQYREVHGDKGQAEDLAKIWKSYEGRLGPKEIEKLKQEYRGKLNPTEAEGLKRAYEDRTGKKP